MKIERILTGKKVKKESGKWSCKGSFYVVKAEDGTVIKGYPTKRQAKADIPHLKQIGYK